MFQVPLSGFLYCRSLLLAALWVQPLVESHTSAVEIRASRESKLPQLILKGLGFRVRVGVRVLQALNACVLSDVHNP